MYYYGARYYDARVSVWLAVDPAFEEFSGFTPYNFTLNNPLRLVDPDGLSPIDIIIYGPNNSSITVKTHLIDISINASSIVGDVGGNYVLEGDDLVAAALDIIGILDPSGAADFTSATIQARKGDVFGAILSGLGVVPYVGDAGKVAKVPKHLRTLRKAIDAIKSGGKKEAGKVDFIVTPDGVAIPKNQKRMREGFDNAGFPKRDAAQTSEAGVIHTVPTMVRWKCRC